MAFNIENFRARTLPEGGARPALFEVIIPGWPGSSPQAEQDFFNGVSSSAGKPAAADLDLSEPGAVGELPMRSRSSGPVVAIISGAVLIFGLAVGYFVWGGEKVRVVEKIVEVERVVEVVE